MNGKRNDGRILLPELAGMHMPATLLGGQTFRWKADDRGGATGFIGRDVGDRLVRAVLTDAGLAVEPLDGRLDGLADIASRYFDADRDYARIERRIFRDARLRRLAGRFSGIRILRQPVFETLVAFIISANNNIPRIRRSVEALALLAGEPVSAGGRTNHAFPLPEALAAFDAATLRAEANLGYRDRYVLETAERIASGAVNLGELDRLKTDELRLALHSLPGVGAKVAECVALFAFGRVEVFPVDTWIRQAYSRLYLPAQTHVTDRDIAARARARFGSHAGIAQQYLFEGMRNAILEPAAPM